MKQEATLQAAHVRAPSESILLAPAGSIAADRINECVKEAKEREKLEEAQRKLQVC